MENQAAVVAVFLLMLLFIGGDKQKHFFCFDISWKGTK